jgi:hypothetical protein
MNQSASRRTFLKVAGSSLLAGGLAPAILGAEDKAGTKPAIIGEGEFQFRCHHNWGDVPAGITWRNTHGVTVNREGFVFIKHQGHQNRPCDTIAVFDPQGKFVRSFGTEYAGGGHGIDIREEDGTEFLYLCDTFHRQVVKCDTEGEWVWKKRYPREPGVYGQLQQFRPTNVCFGPQGDLYVGDGYGAGYIHQYDAAGRWVRSWGGPGTEPGQMRTPHGQWLDDRSEGEPRVVIADRANARLQFFSLDGKPVEILQGVTDPGDHGQRSTQPGPDGASIPVTNVHGISFPADIDVRGEYLLVPDLHARILIFDGRNRLVANLGFDADWTTHVLDGMQVRRNPADWRNGRFVHPHDACFDHQGNIFVTEWVEAGRITFLERV